MTLFLDRNECYLCLKHRHKKACCAHKFNKQVCILFERCKSIIILKNKNDF